MTQNLELNSLEVRKEIARLKILHIIYYNKKILLDSVIPKRVSKADVKFKPIIGRVQAYSNSFLPLKTIKWNTLPANIIKIKRLVKLGDKFNELTN